jgi:spore maturation protein CgeB
MISSKYIQYFKNKNQKVLYLPLNNLIVKQTGMEKAFRDLGFNLCSFDFFLAGKLGNHQLANSLFLQVVRDFKPDWIHMQLQFSNVMEVSTLKTIRKENPNIIMTNWTGDVRNEAMENFVKMAPFMDKSLISSEGQLSLYRDAGCKNLEYWQIGVDPESFYILPELVKQKWKKDYNQKVSFCAGHKPNYQMFPGSIERYQVANGILKKYGNKIFGLYGPGWPNNMSRGPVTYYEQLQVYNTSEIVLSINKYNDLQKYFSDRQLVSMACGPLVISRYIPHMETFFENEKHLVWYKTIPECMSKIDYYLKNPQKAKEIGLRGAKYVIEKHSYLERLKELKSRIQI